MEHGGKEVLSYPLSSPAALEPPGEWDRLRRKCPVAHITFPSGDSGSLLTRYDDVKQVLPQTGEAHLRWRGQISKWFTVRRMNELRTTVEGIVDEVVATMGEFWAYISEHIAAKRTEPGELVMLEGLIVGGLTEVPVRW